MFYKKQKADLKVKKPSQWYSSLKRLSSYDQSKSEPLYIQQISHLSKEQQSEAIADKFSSIANLYQPIQPSDIKIPQFSPADIPQFSPSKIWHCLTKLRANKETVHGDLPVCIFKMFAAYIAHPLTDIINTSLIRAEYPDIYKYELQTPIPKVIPCQSVDSLRNISQLLICDSVMESLIAKLMISDMSPNYDVSQYGNLKNVSIQHYLINMIHTILTAVDKNSKKRGLFSSSQYDRLERSLPSARSYLRN